MAKKIEVPQDPKELPLAVIKQMITLATSGFGLVAALAWNEVVKATVDTYIKPYLPQGSTVLTLFLYAIIVTLLAVFVTLQLAQLEKTLNTIQNRLDISEKNPPSSDKKKTNKTST